MRFDLTSAASATLARFHVDYPTPTGSFDGSGSAVSCVTTTTSTFSRDDDDSGTLSLDLSDAVSLSFPIGIDCTYDVTPGETLITGDLIVTIDQFLDGGVPLDPADLDVAVQIVP